MSKVPTLFGQPLWYGRIKKRVAKKYLNRWSIGYILRYNQKKFATLGIGDLINNCSGFNVEITEIEPEYRSVGNGFVLSGIHFWTSRGGCSLCHCGIEAELSRENIEQEHVKFLKEYYAPNGGASVWFGDKFPEEIEKANKTIALLESGGHIADERGRRIYESPSN